MNRQLTPSACSRPLKAIKGSVTRRFLAGRNGRYITWEEHTRTVERVAKLETYWKLTLVVIGLPTAINTLVNVFVLLIRR